MELLDPTLIPFLAPYVPTSNSSHVLLTWAQSLDAKISAEPGKQTKISSLQTKTMTHYLRSKYNAILVGVGTYLADNPSLSCRYSNDHKIIPIIVDPNFKSYESLPDSKIIQLAKEDKGAIPIIITDLKFKNNLRYTIKNDFKVLYLPLKDGKFFWEEIIENLKNEFSINSIMIEGGSKVIESLLPTKLINSIIITIGPVFLGNKGVGINPALIPTLTNESWWRGDSCNDSIFAGKILQED